MGQTGQSNPQNEEVLNKLMTIVENLQTKQFNDTGDRTPVQRNDQGGSHIIQWPPVPLAGPFGNWSDVREGYSYRFKSKLPVELGDFYSEQGFDQLAAKNEIAALQLHNLENIELLERKERELLTLNTEIEEIRNEMRNMLLIQDELFKQYVGEKTKFEDKINVLSTENKDLKARNEEIEHEIKLVKDLNNALKKNDEASLRGTISEQHKKISIQEINLIRLSRKYDALKSEEKDLRTAYHNASDEFNDKIAEMTQKMNQLLAWKMKCGNQLKILFNLQVNSVPIDEYNYQRSVLDSYKEKYTSMQQKEVNFHARIAKLESNERELHAQNELVRELKEDLMETELEHEMISRR
jgi:hypothetical protein